MSAYSRHIDVVPVMDTNAYANGDVWFATTEVPLGVNARNGSIYLTDVTILDGDDQAAAIYDLYILRSNVALGTINGAISISDANAKEIIGRIRFDGTATAPEITSDLINSRLYHKNMGNVGLPIMVKPKEGNNTSIYIAGAVVTGTPTQTASGINIKLGFSERH